jgi:hypothetical protein
MAGRPSKLTPEVQQIIVDILRNCGTLRAAAGRSRVHMATFLDWMRRGEQATSGKFYDFLSAVKDAEAQAVLMATRTVRLAIVGGWHKVPTRDKDGNYVFKRDAAGEILRDAQGGPEAELADVYKEPDDARAAWFLERRDRANWGGGDTGVTVSVSPAPARPNPKGRQLLDLFSQAVQILVDHGMPLPEPVLLQHQGTKVIETTAKQGGNPRSSLTQPTEDAPEAQTDETAQPTLKARSAT